jgi:hypothetical protein
MDVTTLYNMTNAAAEAEAAANSANLKVPPADTPDYLPYGSYVADAIPSVGSSALCVLSSSISVILFL